MQKFRESLVTPWKAMVVMCQDSQYKGTVQKASHSQCSVRDVLNSQDSTHLQKYLCVGSRHYDC